MLHNNIMLIENSRPLIEQWVFLRRSGEALEKVSLTRRHNFFLKGSMPLEAVAFNVVP